MRMPTHIQTWHLTPIRERTESQRGAAMAEYGLLLAFVALAAIAVVVAFGGSVTGLLSGAPDVLNNAVSQSGTSGGGTTTSIGNPTS